MVDLDAKRPSDTTSSPQTLKEIFPQTKSKTGASNLSDPNGWLGNKSAFLCLLPSFVLSNERAFRVCTMRLAHAESLGSRNLGFLNRDHGFLQAHGGVLHLDFSLKR